MGECSHLPLHQELLVVPGRCLVKHTIVLIANGILMIRLLARWRTQGPAQGLRNVKELAGLWQ